ncbi:thioesterase II family protein [Paraburkholderia sp. BCC1886]|uniref:thioesterase II family protein n=1 Tax=Paraburkholderia sp. BCC1886 TaxID=2562670 RepID=UPI001183E83F|nr:alpha/beta fold hydrolase [Paraburkholderia sp. BCC1886]
MSDAVAPAAVHSVALPPVQLFCLAHAGGTSMLYRRWAQHLPRSVEVVALELPGHGTRRALPASTTWPALIDEVIAQFDARRDATVPFAVFGHSMGALVGLELLHALRHRATDASQSAVWFGASAAVAPSCRIRETHWLGCTHEQMVAKLRSLGGTPEALLADRDFIDFLLPTLRADFHLCGTYGDTAGATAGATRRAPLDCPIDVFLGRDDAATARADDVARWRDETRGTFQQHRFDGAHFYLDDAPGPVLARVASSLADALVQQRGAPARLRTGEAWTQ